MKVLCLHGAGTNPKILEVQVAGIRRLLPSDWQFDFFGGSKPFPPEPIIKSIFPGPYVTYFDSATPEQVVEATDLVGKSIKENGPYDAILGFSQGGSVAASMIIQHQLDHPLDSPLFKFAIFTCGLLPFSRHADLHKEMFDGFRERAADVSPDDPDFVKLSESKYGGSWANWTSAVSSAITPDCSPAVGAQVLNMFQSFKQSKTAQAQQMPTAWHPLWDPDVRINIPTVHILGSKDPWGPSGKLLSQLCQEDKRQVYEHSGGHEIPRSDAVTKAITDLILQASKESTQSPREKSNDEVVEPSCNLLRR